jgi:DNA-binding NarL/FixJ family response regulator
LTRTPAKAAGVTAVIMNHELSVDLPTGSFAGSGYPPVRTDNESQNQKQTRTHANACSQFQLFSCLPESAGGNARLAAANQKIRVSLMLKPLPGSERAAFEPAVKPGYDHWNKRLLRRPYRFPAVSGSDQDLSAHIEHDGTGYFFPLGTANVERAAAKARQIYQMAVSEGWDAAGRHFSRELIVSFEWCMDPVLWTYTTIHTLVGKWGGQKDEATPACAHKHHVLVVEADAGIRQALCWGIDQQEGFASFSCGALESCPRLVALHKPRLVLLNRNLAGRSGFKSAGPPALIESGTTVVTYSAHADGDQMFASTPGGAGGYLIRRVKPDRLLEPILKVASPSELIHRDFLQSVKYYFQDLLQLDSTHDNPALATLTQRERATLELLSKGCVNKEIAQAMGISPWTVHNHIKKIFERLNVRTRTEAVIRYLEK